MPDRPSGQDRPTADYPLPEGYLSNAHHHYLFHPGYPEVYRDDVQVKTTEMDSMERAGTKAGSQRLGGSVQPRRTPISTTCTSNSKSTSASTSSSTSNSGSTPTLQVKPDPSLSPAHFRIPNKSDLFPPTQSHSDIRTHPRETAGPGPRTTEIRERVRMREHTIPRHSLGSDLDGLRGRGGSGGVAGKGYGREDEMDLNMETEMEAEGADANGNGNGNEDRASKTPTAIPDGLDVKDILQTYRALRDRLPDVFPRRGVGTTQPLLVGKPNESTDKSPEGQNAKNGVGTTAPGDKEKEKEKEKEELREILRLAMDGFKLVGSVFADKSNSADRWERRPATEPSGSKRDRGAGYGSFARERAERGRPTMGPAGRSYEWSEAEMSMRSPVGTDAAEFAVTARGPGSAPSLGVSFSSASTTPVSQTNLTPNFGPQELPHRATSGASSNSKSARMDVESSPAEEAFLVERPNSSNATANTGQAQGGQGGVVMGNPVCLGCGATETPEWRRGPMGPRTLCNACGLVFAKLVRKRAREAAKAQAIAKGLLPPKKSRSKKAKLSLVEEVTEA